MSGPVDVMCHGCGAVAPVMRVTAGLRCRCGSRDLDLYTGTPEQRSVITQKTSRRNGASSMIPAARRQPTMPSFTEFMTKRATEIPAKPVGTEIPGWNEYAGPMPGPSQESNGVSTPEVCPTCHGSGFDMQDGQKCRECGGSGVFTPNTTAEVPAVARHEYPSNQTKVPFMGRRKKKAPVARSTNRKTSRLTSLVATIQRSNPGLSEREVAALAQRTLTYLEKK